MVEDPFSVIGIYTYLHRLSNTDLFEIVDISFGDELCAEFAAKYILTDIAM